jgi:hypothetical protein
MLMRSYGLFDDLPFLVIFGTPIMVAILSFEGGFRAGRWRSQRQNHEQEVVVRSEVAIILGLVTFILAFTFWIAASHFDAMRQARLNEVNAIRTTYLRADLLPEPYRMETRNLLREYVDVRLEAFRTGNLEQAIARSEELQDRLWSQAIAAREKVSSPFFAGYVIQSLNEMISLYTRRLMIRMEFRIPNTIWIVLYTLMALAAVAIGYHAGLTGARRPLIITAFVLIFAFVILLIADLDNPARGALRVSQHAMEDLRRTMGGG